MTVVVVKLARAEIRLGVPAAAAQVVEHGDARIPLRNLIERVAPRAHAKAPPSFDVRHLEVPLHIDRCFALGGNGRGKSDTRARRSELGRARCGERWRRAVAPTKWTQA